MLFGDPNDKTPAQSGWSVDWRFDQLLMKLGRYDQMTLARGLAGRRFGSDDLSLLTGEQKAQFISDCEQELAIAIALDDSPAAPRPAKRLTRQRPRRRQRLLGGLNGRSSSVSPE
ncbi:hypothetical protein [Stappia indica]|uniref:hypothetical protein n=1 Tax=Stappia indica TaxID=538381 RepID=UPI00083032B3|nr:hypothetical protein [Stappia indica]MCC4245553.1 hypothetical protein [Stappia indica]